MSIRAVPMTLVLDRYFVQRLRIVAGKDGNPLNEVLLLSESLINNGGVLRANNGIKMRPAESVSKVEAGEPIRLRTAQFERLSEAFLGEVQSRFV